MKLDQYLVDSGFSSRRKALLFINEKKVKVNGKLANVFTPVKANDEVKVNGELVQLHSKVPTFIAYHKPKGIICTSEKIEGNIIDAIKHPQLIYPIGRLDKDSEGLILLTNQSVLIDKIANPLGNHEKEYLVTLNLPVREKFIEEISKGIKIGKEYTKPCQASIEPGTKRVMRITITQGLNWQIRKMCNAFQYQVIKLQRVRIMNVALGHLKLGEWRNLEEAELKELMKQVSLVDKKEKKPTMPQENPSKLKVQEVAVQSPVQLPNPALEIKKTISPPKRLKKHEIKAKQKEPWKKMHSKKNSPSTGSHPKAIAQKKIKPQRRRKDNRLPGKD